jgi:hypothetical protein
VQAWIQDTMVAADAPLKVETPIEKARLSDGHVRQPPPVGLMKDMSVKRAAPS